MFILTDKSTGGVYAVYNKDRVKTVQLFEDSEDAQRYWNLLEAEGFDDELEISEVDVSTVAQNCDNYGYFYTVITKNDFVIPPQL
tara:strand:- start:1609 stop:1863 length:255 start_codon:yes stop_codon:yes gene_type:complete